jgi:hypothetical protein
LANWQPGLIPDTGCVVGYKICYAVSLYKVFVLVANQVKSWLRGRRLLQCFEVLVLPNLSSVPDAIACWSATTSGLENIEGQSLRFPGEGATACGY